MSKEAAYYWYDQNVREKARTNATWEKIRKTVESESFSGYQLRRLHQEIHALAGSDRSDTEVYAHTMAFVFRLTREANQ